MPKSIATVSLSGTLEEKLVAAAGAGFEAVEIFENDLIGSALHPREVRERTDALGLDVVMYQPFRDFDSASRESFERNLARAEHKFELMRALGADTLLVCSNVSADAVDDDAVVAEQLRLLAERAWERGIRIAYEALAWGRHVNTYERAWRIVASGDHAALGICLDSFHILSRGDDPAGIRAIPGEKIFFLQLADAPRLAMDVLQWSRHYRCFPGQGGFDLAGFMRCVIDAGYEGPLSLEVFNDVFRQAPPDRMAVDAMRSLLMLEESIGLGELHSAPELSGYAFSELGIPSASVPEVEQVLAGLGFSLTAVHRSKPVQLWRQAGIDLLLNYGDPRIVENDPRVVALAVESADPDGSAERAETLGAPVLSRRRAPDEADLSSIAAPDGTSVFFCRTAAGSGGWIDDFVRHIERPPSGASDLTRIDHVALSQPFDYFDEAALFYRSVLGLEPGESREATAPDGLVRSRAVANRDGSVRFVLGVSMLGHGAPARSGELQHVAFACRDIFSAARRMTARGLPLLGIPDNYYEDLAARLALDPALIESMQGVGVLYDRSGEGEYLHFYTEMVGRRLFFEVVQRRGAYDGYGEANSAVRMAAQSKRDRARSQPAPERVAG
jgi:4-hydroxyphenylpyruvate dioxygenase